ncbi:hypothetical protein U1Q18_022215 [Sarracenia purpurea var. burkii]
MEVESMSKSGKNNNKKKSLEHVGFDLDDLVGDCLNGEDEYGLVNYGLANDSQYFEIKGKSDCSRWSTEDFETLKISPECLSKKYLQFSDEVCNAQLVVAGRVNDNRRKRGRRFDLFDCKEW